MDELAMHLGSFPFWDKLTEQEKEYVKLGTRLQTYSKGSMIHNSSENCLGMILVIKGEMRAFILSEEGREITLFRLHEGDPCALTASCVISHITFDTQVIAERDCTILVIGSVPLSRLINSNIYVRCFTYELATAHFSDVMTSMQQVLFHKIETRLASFLLGEYKRTGSSTIKMTHEQIAQHISSAREVVARTLKRFSAEGYVELGRSTIKITDTKSLEMLL